MVYCLTLSRQRIFGKPSWATNRNRIERDLNEMFQPITVDVRAIFRDADFLSSVRRHGIRLYVKR
jgi:hypothetical protein